MAAVFSDIAAELIRQTLRATTVNPRVKLVLSRSPSSPNRARGSAIYNPKLFVSWGPYYWTEIGMDLVDRRGYLLEWGAADPFKWLMSALNGVPCGVLLTMADSSSLPPQWTPSRVIVARKRVELDAEAIRVEARAKIRTVEGWAISDRRAAVLAAANRMSGAADWVDPLKAIDAGGEIWEWQNDAQWY